MLRRLLANSNKIICVGRNYAEHAKELGNAGKYNTWVWVGAGVGVGVGVCVFVCSTCIDACHAAIYKC